MKIGTSWRTADLWPLLWSDRAGCWIKLGFLVAYGPWESRCDANAPGGHAEGFAKLRGADADEVT